MFPALKRIVFVGHGGGAQMLVRYAVVMKPQPGPAIGFVIANPGVVSVSHRGSPAGAGEGLPGRGLQQVEVRLERPAALCGQSGPAPEGLCGTGRHAVAGGERQEGHGVIGSVTAAKVQGRNRIDRGRLFVQALAKSGLAPLLKHHIVKNAGHDESAMLDIGSGTEGHLRGRVAFGDSPSHRACPTAVRLR